MTRITFPTLSIIITGWMALTMATASHAQNRKVELGTDARLMYRSVTFPGAGSDVTSQMTQLQLPTGVRVGLFFWQRISLETMLTLNYLKPTDGDGYTELSVAVGPMIHLTGDPTQSESYLRPFLGVNYVNNVEGRSQMFFGGAVGIRFPVGRQGATRFELFGYHAPESDFISRETRFGISAGFSVFMP